MRKDFRWLASELARQTMDSEADSTLDLSISRASDIIKALREIARFAPGAVADALDLAEDCRPVMPACGICLPCEWVSCQNGNTIHVKLRAGQQIAVELMDYHISDGHTEAGRKAAGFLDSLFEQNGELRVWFPLVDEKDTEALVRILRPLTYETAAGRVYIGTKDVSEIMVEHGFATKEVAT